MRFFSLKIKRDRFFIEKNSIASCGRLLFKNEYSAYVLSRYEHCGKTIRICPRSDASDKK